VKPPQTAADDHPGKHSPLPPPDLLCLVGICQEHPFLYRNLNLTFKAGHLTVMMGPSGCGKSTLAKLLLGFYQPTDGRILIFDEAVSNLDQQTAEHFAATVNSLKGTVTMLFITHQLPKGLQVDEVFRFGAQPVQPNVMEVAGQQGID
jgi:ABC-type bacteriocin/lantibiotic exporter with double-glycine peptidase domain